MRASTTVLRRGPARALVTLQQLLAIAAADLRTALTHGLGLYIARRVATAHGGELVADSPPGKGSRFVLRIPTYQDASLA